MLDYDEINRLKDYIARTTDELELPIRVMLADRSMSSMLNVFGDIPSLNVLFGITFFILSTQLAHADGNYSNEEAAVFLAIKHLFADDDDKANIYDEWDEINPEYISVVKKSWREVARQHPDVQSDVTAPFIFLLLRRYDEQYHTQYADVARTMFLRYANFFLKADGTVNEKEKQILSRFQALLAEGAPQESAQSTSEESQLGITTEALAPAEDVPSLDELLEELNSLVGLESVKNDVVELVNFLKIQQMREERGLEAAPVSRHLVFYGNPGTGKTTISRLISKIYRSLSILSKGHLVETDRSGLVAGYVGQTALKVRDVVNSAIGGVLFIDEAYSLAAEGQDFGREAIETLIKMMEDNRDDLVVIVAGYTDKMNSFLSSNPGLKSRFNKYFYYEDYTPPQLVQIFELFCKRNEYKLSEKAREKLMSVFQVLFDVRDETFGNARLARNVFEKTIHNQANRIISVADISENVLCTIEAVDIPGDVDLRAITGNS